MKKIAIVLVVLSLLFLWMFGGCVIPQKQLKVSTNEIVLFVGDTFEIQVESHSLDQVVFSSDNTAIATVDTNGIVAAIGEGEAQILVTASTQTVKVNVIVSKKETNASMEYNVTFDENDAKYAFEIKQDGIYDFKIAESGLHTTVEVADDVVFNFDDNYSTRLKSRKINDSGQIEIGAKYLKKGAHTLTVKNANAYLSNSKVVLNKALSYSDEGLELGRLWWNVLYQETGYNTEEPNYLGFVETEGWEDLWTHCQYLPYSMYLAKNLNDTEYDRRIKKIADDLLIGRMLTKDGAVYTIYRADSDVFNVSIESDMPTNKYEIWRGQSAFIEEMLNCYLYTKDEKYLQYAEIAAQYILDNWSKTNITGIFGGIYTRYSSSAGATIDIMSAGRNVMVFAQLYQVTSKPEYLSAAKQQAKVLLKAQEAKYQDLDGLFANTVDTNGNLGEFRHGNAYANAMLGLAWMYKVTEEEKYLEAIDKGINVLKKVYDDEYGMVIVMDGQLLHKNSSTGLTYLAGRMGQAIMTCAAFVGNEYYYSEGERIIEFVLGRNYGNVNVQNNRGGFTYSVEYYTSHYNVSNTETSGEIYLALMQYYYLSEIWGFNLK